MGYYLDKSRRSMKNRRRKRNLRILRDAGIVLAVLAVLVPAGLWFRNFQKMRTLNEKKETLEKQIAKAEKDSKDFRKTIDEANALMGKDSSKETNDTDGNHTSKAPGDTDASVQSLGVKLDDTCLFVGDSIFDTVATAGVLPDVKFLTLIGLNVDTVQTGENFLTKNGKVNGVDAIEQSDAKNIFITLGINGMGFMDKEYMIKEYKKFLGKLLDGKSDRKVFVLSVSPITGDFEPEIKDEGFTNDDIDQYNKMQKEMAEGISGAYYIDISTDLKNDKNELKKEYADADGLHWTSEGCKQFKNTMESALGIN